MTCLVCPLLTYPTAVQSQLREVSVRCQSSGYRGKGESGAVFTARAKWSPLGTELGVRQDVITSLSDRDPPERNLAAVLRPG